MPHANCALSTRTEPAFTEAFHAGPVRRLVMAPWAAGAVADRRRWLAGAAALVAGAGVGSVLAYPHVNVARLWYDVVGVDVSNHQGDIDWPRLARTDIAF